MATETGGALDSWTFFGRGTSALLEAAWRRLNAPIDIASLVAFRVLFGSVMCFAMIRFLAKGWVQELLVAPQFHFTYSGFSWIAPWPGWWMHVHVGAMALLALGIAVGLFYRWCAALFLLGFVFIELIDKATYLNHYYLVTLLAGLLVVMPAHQFFSVDAWRNPSLENSFAPAWTIYLLRFQVAVVYVFAGLAKLTPDWLWLAQPLRIWLTAKGDLPWVGASLGEPWVAYAASWAGAAYDLTIVFLLLWPRTRGFAYACVVVFHVSTWVLFPIGMFPWIMLAATSVFFSPGWPRRWLGQSLCRGDSVRMRGRLEGWGARGGLVAFVIWQTLFPLRHLVCAGPCGWTYSGFNFAWRVMIVEKAGYVEFLVADPRTHERWRVRASEYLTPFQAKIMAQDPDMIRALARHIAEDFERRGNAGVEVRAEAFATLNGRPSRRLIDPEVNLAGEISGAWILPLEP